MATRRRKKSSRRRKSSARAAHCKVVRVNGRRRKLCWGKSGRLVSNRAA